MSALVSFLCIYLGVHTARKAYKPRTAGQEILLCLICVCVVVSFELAVLRTG